MSMASSPPAAAAGSSSEMASDLRFLLPPLDFLPFLAAGFLGSGLSRSGIVAPAALASFSRADALRLSSASVDASESARLRAAGGFSRSNRGLGGDLCLGLCSSSLRR